MKTKKKQETNKSLSYIKGIVLIFIITMSLIHVFYNDKYDKLTAHKKTYKPIISERKAIEMDLLTDLQNNKISKTEYISKLLAHKELYAKKIKDYNKEKKELAYEFSFHGRNSFHYWLFIFGLAFSFFCLALRYTYNMIVNSNNKSLTKSFVFESSAWLAVSLFWVFHAVFVNNADLPKPVYAIVMFLVCLLIGFSILYTIKYIVHRKTHTLKSYKNSIIKLISLVADIRANHYFHMAAKAQNDRNKASIEKDVEIVDDKIFSTLEKVADES
ncbi:hypothetical protein [Kordia jejudonensis]|uniref:hypothetical protein n=1 Tax=Kordia jejudonensis TaxID=1348245 RepID=UPI0012DFFCE1|nr:hypothetical protein [Kordia jejudonensis]